MSEREKEVSPEERIYGLRDSIVTTLRARGGRQNNRTISPRYGIDCVKVLSDGVAGKLLLAADGNWQIRALFTGYELESPETNDLLNSTALLIDDKYPQLFGQKGKTYEEIMEERKMYVEQNKARLSEKLIDGLSFAFRGLFEN